MKNFFLCFLVAFMLLAVSCSTTESDANRSVNYINQCATVGDGSNQIPGTFTLPTGKRVSPGSTVMDGNFVYAAGKGVNKDPQIAVQEARFVILSAINEYLGATMHTSASTGFSSYNGNTVASSSSQTLITADNISKGLSEFGSVYEASTNTTYLLMRMPTNYADALKSNDPKKLEEASRALDVVNKAVNIGAKVGILSKVLSY